MKVENSIAVKWLLFLLSVLFIFMAGKIVIVQNQYTTTYIYTFYRTERALYNNNTQLRKIASYPSSNRILKNNYIWKEYALDD